MREWSTSTRGKGGVDIKIERGGEARGQAPHDAATASLVRTDATLDSRESSEEETAEGMCVVDTEAADWPGRGK